MRPYAVSVKRKYWQWFCLPISSHYYKNNKILIIAYDVNLPKNFLLYCKQKMMRYQVFVNFKITTFFEKIFIQIQARKYILPLVVILKLLPKLFKTIYCVFCFYCIWSLNMIEYILTIRVRNKF